MKTKAWTFLLGAMLAVGPICSAALANSYDDEVELRHAAKRLADMISREEKEGIEAAERRYKQAHGGHGSDDNLLGGLMLLGLVGLGGFAFVRAISKHASPPVVRSEVRQSYAPKQSSAQTERLRRRAAAKEACLKAAPDKKLETEWRQIFTEYYQKNECSNDELLQLAKDAIKEARNIDLSPEEMVAFFQGRRIAQILYDRVK